MHAPTIITITVAKMIVLFYMLCRNADSNYTRMSNPGHLVFHEQSSVKTSHSRTVKAKFSLDFQIQEYWASRLRSFSSKQHNAVTAIMAYAISVVWILTSVP